MLAAGTLAFTFSFAASMRAETVRFDHTVRNDFFAGFTGNREALERGMKTAAATLAENPNHAEALVWHGAGLYFQAGEHFRKGDAAKGMEVYRQAFTEMDKAVVLAPDNIGVRIPRGAALLAATAAQPMDDRVRGEVRRAVDDYQHVYDMQKGYLDKLGTHPLGQLLMDLGFAYSRVGDNEKAKLFFDQLEEKLPGTEWAKRAALWKQNGKLTPQESRCIGCHVSK